MQELNMVEINAVGGGDSGPSDGSGTHTVVITGQRLLTPEMGPDKPDSPRKITPTPYQPKIKDYE